MFVKTKRTACCSFPKFGIKLQEFNLISRREGVQIALKLDDKQRESQCGMVGGRMKYSAEKERRGTKIEFSQFDSQGTNFQSNKISY